ncbi:BadF-type ATPase [Agreia bicolorata]|uniref:BadF-type ATPase n=1 Tax=Agreia bicolorata TaxID=110935 RepID=A0A1T4YFP9_9MICO|nr:BadF/BadG/BcrA/BcrD ATPase family protein [Agreia bicolorata]SKB00523.1 BadF-type ATPase [Agreia bicolorata]
MPSSAQPPRHPSSTAEARDDEVSLTVVGIDVGGTKTHIRAVDTTGSVAEIVVPSAEWRRGSLFSDDDNFARLSSAVHSLGAVASDTVVVAGVHGCDTDEQTMLATTRLRSLLNAEVTVVNDALLLHHATTIRPTIEMIVGTGAVISGTTATGARVTVDGYGWPLGDKGSSHALVSAALRATLDASDKGQVDQDTLFPAMLSSFDARNAAELAERSASNAGGASWGRHASVVFDQAEAGSRVACDIIDRAASELADGVTHAVRRGAVGRTVVAGGGVIVNQPGYEAAIRGHLERVLPGVELLVVRTPPVQGAVQWARELRAALAERSVVGS